MSLVLTRSREVVRVDGGWSMASSWSPFQSFEAIFLAPKYNQTKENRFRKASDRKDGDFVVALAPK